MAQADDLTVNEEQVRKAIQSGVPLTITTYTLPHEVEIYINEVVSTFLKCVGQEAFKDYLVYCIQELAVNAKKANTKRVYFAEKGLDLGDPRDYEEGMKTFRDDTLDDISHYLKLQKERGLYIKLVLQLKQNAIHIEVRNNVPLIKSELIRVHDKMNRARQYKNLEEALSQVIDDSEGAGLGLVIMLLMLRNIGLGEECFDLLATEKETVSKLIIPLNKTHVESLNSISRIIVKNIDSLPQFPENILRAKALIEDPECDIVSISKYISTDVGLTVDLLKIVNSAHYMVSKKVDSIGEAVKMVGMRGVKNLLFSYGAQKILGENTEEKRALWDHCYRTAYYALNIGRNYQRDPDFIDDVYVGGMLHDMGKIIFTEVHPTLIKKIDEFCKLRNGLSSSAFETLAAGMNHAETGALIAENWNFPDHLVAMVRYHHDPISAPTEFRCLVDTVYLANMLCGFEKHNIDFEQIDPLVLESFNIKSKKELTGLLTLFSKGIRQTEKSGG
jgi:putative nucleotidyltransferase with HDIG domain